MKGATEGLKKHRNPAGVLGFFIKMQNVGKQNDMLVSVATSTYSLRF